MSHRVKSAIALTFITLMIGFYAYAVWKAVA